jgi:putative permease
MSDVLKNWFNCYFSDPQAVILCVLIVAGILVIHTTGYMFAPVFAGLVIAYLLQGMVNRLTALKLPHGLAVSIVFIIFMSAVVLGLFVLLPQLLHQLTNLFTEFPSMLNRGQALLMTLPENYPDYITAEQVDSVVSQFKSSIGKFGQWVLSFSLASIAGMITTIIYVVLVPLLIFFFLWDQDKLLDWLALCLPKKRGLLMKMSSQINRQLGNYVRGKVLEILIVAVTTYLGFVLMGLPYAMLLAVLVGLSVIIPFIGIIVVTIPVVIIAFLQWGWSPHFAYLLLVYTAIGILDANLLVPLLFAGAVDLHPVAIIVAILFFGGLWGFWGVFFAIPLAVVVKAMITSWPRSEKAVLT